MNDLLKGGVRREIVDVVAAIREAAYRAFDITELGRPDDDAFETPIDNGWQGILQRVVRYTTSFDGRKVSTFPERRLVSQGIGAPAG